MDMEHVSRFKTIRITEAVNNMTNRCELLSMSVLYHSTERQIIRPAPQKELRPQIHFIYGWLIHL